MEVPAVIKAQRAGIWPSVGGDRSRACGPAGGGPLSPALETPSPAVPDGGRSEAPGTWPRKPGARFSGPGPGGTA